MKTIDAHQVDVLYQMMTDYPSLEAGIKGLIAGKSYVEVAPYLRDLEDIPDNIRQTLGNYLYETMGWEVLRQQLRQVKLMDLPNWIIPHLPITRQEAMETFIEANHYFPTDIARHRVATQKWCNLDFYISLTNAGCFIDVRGLNPSEDLIRYAFVEEPLPTSHRRRQFVEGAVQMGYADILSQLEDNVRDLNHWRLTHGVNTHLVPHHAIDRKLYLSLLVFWAAQSPSTHTRLDIDRLIKLNVEGHMAAACGGYYDMLCLDKMHKSISKRLQTVINYRRKHPQVSPVVCLKQFLPTVYQQLDDALKEGKD